MPVKSWIEQSLWKDGYFMPEKAGERLEIFRCGLSYPLLASLIDGCYGYHTWTKRDNESPTRALFECIRPLVQRDGASWFYVTDPDNALSVFHWEREVKPEFLNEYPLEEFERNPAEQGGVSYLGLGFHHCEGLLVFELNNGFIISFYGNPKRLEEFRECLKAIPDEDLSDTGSADNQEVTVLEGRFYSPRFGAVGADGVLRVPVGGFGRGGIWDGGLTLGPDHEDFQFWKWVLRKWPYSSSLSGEDQPRLKEEFRQSKGGSAESTIAE